MKQNETKLFKFKHIKGGVSAQQEGNLGSPKKIEIIILLLIILY
jgi:hypothetical protein